jgi:hypothetical protein
MHVVLPRKLFFSLLTKNRTTIPRRIQPHCVFVIWKLAKDTLLAKELTVGTVGKEIMAR